MSEHFCNVPMPESLKEHALIHNPDSVYKYVCGRKAAYKVGNWYVCEGHKKYYTDPNKWPAEPLEGVIDDETNES